LSYVFASIKKGNTIEGALWTSKQRQSSSLHEVSYRACFKAELPRFFIERYSNELDTVYDPFAGRGTTGIEAGLMRRKVILNDINPLMKILAEPRFFIIDPTVIFKRLEEIPLLDIVPNIDLAMFFHENTLREILSIREYLCNKNKLDIVDKWIQLLVTNRLTGHSQGFLSVYTMPPNQAVTQERQRKINKAKNQIPEYRNLKESVLKKYQSLIRNLSVTEKANLTDIKNKIKFLNKDASDTPTIRPKSVKLIITSPPFLNVVRYDDDNWLRLWFNNINRLDLKITMLRDINDWSKKMQGIFQEFSRILQCDGRVAFEVGEVNKGKIKLDDYIIPIGEKAGLIYEGRFINKQSFTKTANIWGVENNRSGTNTNRIVLFKKERNI